MFAMAVSLTLLLLAKLRTGATRVFGQCGRSRLITWSNAVAECRTFFHRRQVVGLGRGGSGCRVGLGGGGGGWKFWVGSGEGYFVGLACDIPRPLVQIYLLTRYASVHPFVCL